MYYCTKLKDQKFLPSKPDTLNSFLVVSQPESTEKPMSFPLHDAYVTEQQGCIFFKRNETISHPILSQLPKIPVSFEKKSLFCMSKSLEKKNTWMRSWLQGGVTNYHKPDLSWPPLNLIKDREATSRDIFVRLFVKHYPLCCASSQYS